jgi:hypothetical protein
VCAPKTLFQVTVTPCWVPSNFMPDGVASDRPGALSGTSGAAAPMPNSLCSTVPNAWAMRYSPRALGCSPS